MDCCVYIGVGGDWHVETALKKAGKVKLMAVEEKKSREFLKGRAVTVLGLGVSGFACAQFLYRKGVHVFVSECRNGSEIAERRRHLESSGIETETGRHSLKRILASELVILSPGISPAASIYRQVRDAHLPVWSEIELAFRFSTGEIIAVTGTNGKTTVATLLYQIFQRAGRHAVLCGNIGNPWIGEIESLTPSSFVILEVSSFQLAHIDRFSPRTAVLLNLTENHLDWHGSFNAYADAKWRVFQNQTRADTALINRNDPESLRRVSRLTANVIYFQAGKRDSVNMAVCRAISEKYGLEEKETADVIKKFQGLEHRLEVVPSNDDIIYINDSKSTTIASLLWALARTAKPVVLIMGGRHKGGDFSKLKSQIRRRVCFLIVMGESRSLIKNTFSEAVQTIGASSLEEAVRLARRAVVKGGTILFSPACASFDMFLNYKDRGNRFKQLVKKNASSNLPHTSPPSSLRHEEKQSRLSI